MNVMITGLKMPKRCPINALIYPDGRAIITLHSGKTMECRAEEAADVRHVVRGRWVDYPECLKFTNAYSDDHIVCSACEECFSILDNDCERFNFCPNCGADMREEN